MSQENVALVHSGLDAVNRGGIEAVLHMCDPEIEWIAIPGFLPDAQDYHGRAGVRAWLRRSARPSGRLSGRQMSQEWIELVRAGFDAVERGDLAAFDGMTHPDVVMVQPPEVPDAKSYEGPGAIVEAMDDWPGQWEDFHMDLIEIIDAGDEVAVGVTRQQGRGRESGIEMDFEVFYVLRGRNGKLARMDMFFNREQALEAAGLKE